MGPFCRLLLSANLASGEQHSPRGSTWDPSGRCDREDLPWSTAVHLSASKNLKCQFKAMEESKCGKLDTCLI